MTATTLEELRSRQVRALHDLPSPFDIRRTRSKVGEAHRELQMFREVWAIDQKSPVSSNLTEHHALRVKTAKKQVEAAESDLMRMERQIRKIRTPFRELSDMLDRDPDSEAEWRRVCRSTWETGDYRLVLEKVGMMRENFSPALDNVHELTAFLLVTYIGASPVEAARIVSRVAFVRAESIAEQMSCDTVLALKRNLEMYEYDINVDVTD